MRHIKWILLVSAVLGVLVIYSYYSSKQTANELVGKSLDYVELSDERITLAPFERKLAWEFNYSHPGSYDEEFWIYTNLFGKVILTNPRDLAVILREFEKLEVYPYPKIERKKK